MADTGAHPAVELHVDAKALRVIDKDESEKDRNWRSRTASGPEVLEQRVRYSPPPRLSSASSSPPPPRPPLTIPKSSTPSAALKMIAFKSIGRGVVWGRGGGRACSDPRTMKCCTDDETRCDGVTVQVMPKDGYYTGPLPPPPPPPPLSAATVKQTDFGIKPPGKAGIRTKDEVQMSRRAVDRSKISVAVCSSATGFAIPPRPNLC